MTTLAQVPPASPPGASTPDGERSGGFGASVQRVLAEKPIYLLAALLVVFYLAAGIGVDHSMMTFAGVRSILMPASIVAILGAAQTVCMLTGGIDMSVTMIATFAAYICMVNAQTGPVPAMLLALLAGAIIGAVNGIGVGVFKVSAMIMTLGMQSVLLGITVVGLVGGGFFAGASNVLPAVLSMSNDNAFWLVPWSTIVWVVVGGLFIALLARTGLGRNLYGVGDNEIACRLAGIRVWRVHIAVYVIAGMLSAIAGLLIAGTNGAVSPGMSNIYLLPSVAAVVIGGTSVMGGIGGYGGTIVGALILTVLNRVLLQWDMPEAVRQIIYGLIVLALAWVYVKATKRRT